MGVLKFEKTVILTAGIERAWELLSNTDLLNREMGLPPPEFSFSPRNDGGTRARGEVAAGPFRLQYEEHPFEWDRPFMYSVRRTFEGGPFSEIVGGVNLQEQGRCTSVTSVVEIDCRRGGAAAAKLFIADAFRRFERACSGFEHFLSDGRTNAYPRESSRPPADPARLNEASRVLLESGQPATVVERLIAFFRDSPAAETILFRPTTLAHKLGLERLETLRLCLVAADCGFMDLSWRVMCPYCRGNRQVFGTLRELSSRAHCDACGIEFDSTFDENVEVLFSVAHSVRPVVRAAYCIGGPYTAPHVVAQFVLAPGERRVLLRPIPAGRYRLLSRQSREPLRFSCEAGAAIEISPERISMEPTEGWSMVNRHVSDVTLRVERLDSTEEVVSAAEVTLMGEFRSRFSSEVLSPDTEIAVRQVCVLFTDLKDSTRMYRDRGDAPSYAAVRRHFERLQEIVSRHGGTLVKTIGDAVMASFHEPLNGVQAALAMQSGEDELVLKVGVHAGPAIVVNANGMLDYFGRSVNLAARLQKFGSGGDVILTEELARDPRVSELLQDIPTERLVGDIRGVGEDVPVIRIGPLSAFKVS